MSTGVGMSCWHSSKEPSFLWELPLGGHSLPCLCSLGGGVHFQGAPRTAWGNECLLALPSCSPGRHQDRAQNILISFKWAFLSHTVLSFCSFLSWTRATPKGCSGLLPLTLELPVSSLSLLRGSWSQQGFGKSRRHKPPLGHSQLTHRRWESREERLFFPSLGKLNWYMEKNSSPKHLIFPSSVSTLE